MSFQYSCEFCEIRFPDTELKVCSGCRMARYCSKEHQKLDWQHHRLHCKSIQNGTATGQRLRTSAPTTKPHFLDTAAHKDIKSRIEYVVDSLTHTTDVNLISSALFQISCRIFFITNVTLILYIYLLHYFILYILFYLYRRDQI